MTGAKTAGILDLSSSESWWEIKVSRSNKAMEKQATSEWSLGLILCTLCAVTTLMISSVVFAQSNGD